MRFSTFNFLSVALLLPLLPVTGLPAAHENLNEARDHVQSCNPNNCLRAYQNYFNFHAATSFCATFIPPGTYSTITTAYTHTETFGQFSPTITTNYTRIETYSYLRTLAPYTEIPWPPPTPTTASVTTTTYPAFLKACDYDVGKISSACSCVVPSVTTVLDIAFVQVEDVYPYTGTFFRR